MTEVTARAPSKVIVLGEHFVVLNSRALSTAVSIYSRATAEDGGEGVIIESKSMGVRARLDVGSRAPDPRLEPFAEALRRLRSMDYDLAPARVVVDSDAPPSAGLGSSASTVAAFLLAYTTLVGDPLNKDNLFSITLAAEDVAHGASSGVDPATVVYGGTILYSIKDRVIERLEGPIRGARLIIADSGVRRSTAGPVMSVIELRRRLGQPAELIYSAADIVALRGIEALKRGDAAELGLLMNFNHGLLSAIGVSSPELEDLVYAARAAGALGSKLSGAGRGGIVIALAPEGSEDKVTGALRARAPWVLKPEVGVPGAEVVELTR